MAFFYAKSLPKFVQYYENIRPYSLPNQDINIAHQNKQTLQERLMQLYTVPTEGPFCVGIRLMQV